MVAAFPFKVAEATRAENGGWVVSGQWYADETVTLQALAAAAYSPEPWLTRLEISSASDTEWWAYASVGSDRVASVGPACSPYEAAKALAELLDKQRAA